MRRGTANVFCVAEPLAGHHLSKAIRRRDGAEFAHMLRDIARAYRRAKTIDLVVDDLSTHSVKPLIKHVGPRRGLKLWKRFTVHDTPKHGSSLNFSRGGRTKMAKKKRKREQRHPFAAPSRRQFSPPTSSSRSNRTSHF